MNIALVAQGATALLRPYLPYLLKLSDKAAEEVAKKLGGDTWDQVKALWGKLSPKIERVPAAREAVSDAASMPNDEDAAIVLRVQIKKLLAQDSALAHAVDELLNMARCTGVNVVVSGNRAVGIAGNMSGGLIATGDGNSKSPQ